MDDREYDVVVIGAGPTGENVADRARLSVDDQLGITPREVSYRGSLVRSLFIS